MASSLMKSLARIAAGVIVAKGVGSVMRQAQGGQTTASRRQTGGGILGDILGQVTGGSRTASAGSSGGLGDLLGQVLGGGAQRAGTGRSYGGPNSPGAQGGLGGILDSLTRTAAPQSGSSNAGGLGQILAGGAAAGGLGGLLGGLLGGSAQAGAQKQSDASFGEVFNDALVRQDEPTVPPTPEQNAVAGLMLAAMIQAAKSDGKIDDAEKQRLMGQLGDDLDDETRNFIKEQMMAPVDPQALAREVPKGLEQQVYLMSLMAIDFDSQAEAQYLRALADAMGLNDQQIAAIHQHVGVQNLPA